MMRLSISFIFFFKNIFYAFRVSLKAGQSKVSMDFSWGKNWSDTGHFGDLGKNFFQRVLVHVVKIMAFFSVFFNKS